MRKSETKAHMVAKEKNRSHGASDANSFSVDVSPYQVDDEIHE